MVKMGGGGMWVGGFLKEELGGGVGSWSYAFSDRGWLF
jgi:hypothetical protein